MNGEHSKDEPTFSASLIRRYVFEAGVGRDGDYADCLVFGDDARLPAL